MSTPHDHAQSTTDLLPTRATHRQRRSAPTVSTAPTAQLPQETPGAGGDLHTDEPAIRTPTPRHSPAPVAEPRTPLHTLPGPLADVVTIRQSTLVEHELVLTPGATAADVTTAMIMIPPGAALVGHRRGADVSLLFRESPDGVAHGHPTGPQP